jgi:redox-sensing transcriptional repressor
MESQSISAQTLQRLPLFLTYLKSLPKDGAANISATTIADALDLNDVQVRKDLASVSSGGRPKIGYITEDLIFDIEQFLGYDDVNSAVVIGAGNIGHALLSYNGFAEYGLDIIAAFDIDKSIIGTAINGKQVLPANKLKDLCSRMKVRIGIITVPGFEAQAVCDILVGVGVLAIWNFTSVHLNVPDNVLVQNENMACSLAVLSKHLTEKLFECK